MTRQVSHIRLLRETQSCPQAQRQKQKHHVGVLLQSAGGPLSSLSCRYEVVCSGSKKFLRKRWLLSIMTFLLLLIWFTLWHPHSVFFTLKGWNLGSLVDGCFCVKAPPLIGGFHKNRPYCTKHSTVAGLLEDVMGFLKEVWEVFS